MSYFRVHAVAIARRRAQRGRTWLRAHKEVPKDASVQFLVAHGFAADEIVSEGVIQEQRALLESREPDPPPHPNPVPPEELKRI